MGEEGGINKKMVFQISFSPVPRGTETQTNKTLSHRNALDVGKLSQHIQYNPFISYHNINNFDLKAEIFIQL